MSQARLTAFLNQVRVANSKFTESRSCLEALLKLMRAQVNANAFNIATLRAAIAKARADKRGAKYEAALQYVERTWGKGELEYKGPAQADFADVLGPLYVMKGTQVTFRDVETATTQNHTFSANSASHDPAGQITVNLTFGTQARTAKAIVFELTPTLTFADNFHGRSDADLGVNERVTLGFSVVPAGVSAAQAGNPLWTLHGTIPANADIARQLKGKLQRGPADAAAPLHNGTAFFIAPWATDSGFPTGPRPTKLSSATTLRLVIQSGVSQGQFVEKTFTVHTPQARMVARAPYRHVQGKPSSGFIGDIYFDPKNVSFKYIEFQEGRGTMVAKQTGFKRQADARFGVPVQQLPVPPSGYFAREESRVHAHTGGWVTIGNGNATNGCKLNGSDDVYSGWNDHWPAKYTDAHGPLRGKETDVPSEVSWPINWKYKPVDLAATVTAQQAVHKATMDAAGTVTISKAGASATRLLTDTSVA